MTGEELVQEGQRLARPCVVLDREGAGGVVAVWGGAGIVAAPEGPYRHWLSVDCRFLPQKPAGLSGVLSVYTNEEDGETGVAAADGAASLPVTPGGGLPLFGRPALSLPPIEALSIYGSAAVREWLTGGASVPDGADNKAAERETAEAYTQAWMNQCPLYWDEEPYAVLGGWHMPWPEGDWQQLSDKYLLAWTFKDAEPWVEAWADDDGPCAVIQRIS